MCADGGFILEPENVLDYPRPPHVEPVPHRLRVELGHEVVADTMQGLRALETFHAPTYYIPRSDVHARLRSAPGRTFCEWKGVAQYFDVLAGDQTAERAAWCYNKPSSNFTPLAGHVAFYAGLMSACYVGPVRVIPQPGSFYGGWVTPNLTGPVKGAPGTRHW